MNKTPSPHQQKRTKKPILTLLMSLWLGWLILFGWAMMLWMRFDFDTAIKTMKHLALMQASLVASFDTPTLLIHWLALHNPQFNLPAALSFKEITQFSMIASQTTQILWMKLCILITAFPLLILAMLAGLIDGLNQRAIRTANLGRESTFIFHKSIPTVKKISTCMILLWLCLPLPLPASGVFLSLAVLLGFAVSISARHFKKYL